MHWQTKGASRNFKSTLKKSCIQLVARQLCFTVQCIVGMHKVVLKNKSVLVFCYTICNIEKTFDVLAGSTPNLILRDFSFAGLRKSPTASMVAKIQLQYLYALFRSSFQVHSEANWLMPIFRMPIIGKSKILAANWLPTN